MRWVVGSGWGTQHCFIILSHSLTTGTSSLWRLCSTSRRCTLVSHAKCEEGATADTIFQWRVHQTVSSIDSTTHFAWLRPESYEVVDHWRISWWKGWLLTHWRSLPQHVSFGHWCVCFRKLVVSDILVSNCNLGWHKRLSGSKCDMILKFAAWNEGFACLGQQNEGRLQDLWPILCTFMLTGTLFLLAQIVVCMYWYIRQWAATDSRSSNNVFPTPCVHQTCVAPRMWLWCSYHFI